MKEVSQTLAGRTDIHYLLSMTRQEATRFSSPSATLEECVFAGGYTEVLKNPKMNPAHWYSAYVRIYLERDARGLILEASLLETSFVTFRLPSFYRNVRKLLVN